MDTTATATPDLARSVALLAAFAVGLGLVLRVLAGLRRLRPVEPVPAADEAAPDARGESGVAAVEFALVAPVGLMLLLLIFQTAMMVQANLIVGYASFCAARSAVVWIPRPMPGPGDIARLSDPNAQTDGVNSISVPTVDSPKILRIQSAAAYACWPISGMLMPETAQAAAGNRLAGVAAANQAMQFMTEMPGSRYVFGRFPPEEWVNKYLYSILNTRVKVDKAPDPNDWGRFGPDTQVYVTVEHDFALRVPFAGRLLGARKTQIGAAGIGLAADERLYVTTIRASTMLINEGRPEHPAGSTTR